MTFAARGSGIAFLGGLAWLLATALPRAARGEVRDAAERLAKAWRERGASVVVEEPRFLNDDQTMAVILPELPDGVCTTVVLLGARGLGFHVSAGDGRNDAIGHVPSEAGVLSIERCHDPVGRRLLVTSESGRGSLEVIVARSETPLPAVQLVLPERSGGGLGPMPDPGLLAPLPPPEKRADLVELRARRDGATAEPRSTWQAAADGSGGGEITLQPGCHLIELFAPDPRAAHPATANVKGARLDLDAEMRNGADDRLMARDRSDAPDAQLPVCVGETTEADVAFIGAPTEAAVLVTHVGWPLPEHLPAVWGADARARSARILLARHVASLPSAAVQLAQGGSGVTPVPLSVEPGGCYVAVVALVQGSARGLGLHVGVGARSASDDRGVEGAGAAVAFCAGERSVATAEVEAHGTPLFAWGLALYRLSSGVWVAPR